MFETIIAERCACGKPLKPGARWCSKSCWCRRDAQRRRAGTYAVHHKGHKGVVKPEKAAMDMEPFGVDGEGIDQKYILLACSNGMTIANERNGLSTVDCFEFLLSLPRNHLTFGFAFTYDVNMMLRDLGQDALTRLATYGKVYWADYRIKHVPGKQFIVTNRETQRSICVWDMYPWVQSSFVTMLKEWNLTSVEVVNRIASMKDQRSTFEQVPFDHIKRYCIEECQLLSQAISQLVESVGDLGYRPSAWYSPGSLAAVAMERNQVRKFRKEPPTKALRESVDKAYYGGRSEVSVIGPIEGPIYENDIRSAYPYAATMLPCFAHGHWEMVRDLEPWSLVRVHWTGPRQMVWGPYPVRPERGSLRFPRTGTTWVWGVEALAGKPLCSSFNIESGYTWVPECNHHPFRWLNDIYSARQELKATNDHREYVYKLILNSVYGKLAQRIGTNDLVPTHRFLPWAGLITATTRAMLLEQIVDAGEDSIILTATDGILSRKPLQTAEGTNLGQWETKQYDEGFIGGPGFYWCDGERVIEPKFRNRGLARSDITLEQLRAAWEQAGRAGKVTTSTRRFIGYRLALRRLNTPEVWRRFVDMTMVKQLTVEPRREWLTGDIRDGRSIAPSLASHKRTEKQDRALLNQMAFRLYEGDESDITVLSTLAAEVHPYDAFEPFEQPDWAIDQMTHG